MRITRDEPGNVLKISGTVDMSAAETLRAALADCSEAGVDLSEVDECDTAAVQLLCAAHRSAERSQKPFRLLALSPAVTEFSSAIGLSFHDLRVGDSAL